MKRLLLLFFVLALCLTGCAAPAALETTAPATTGAPETSAPETAQPETTVPGGDPDALSDYELFDAVFEETLDLVYSYPSEEEALDAMTPARRVFYILTIYDMEIQNGGLCQFFVNSSGALAAQVPECLEIIGAEEHLRLFTDFLAENEIDPADLESFRIRDLEDYQAQLDRFDYDSFDMAYYSLPHINEWLLDYVRANPEDFQ